MPVIGGSVRTADIDIKNFQLQLGTVRGNKFYLSMNDWEYECPELKVGLKLLEQLFGIQSGELTKHVSENYPELVIAPGAPSVFVSKVGDILFIKRKTNSE